jgi:short-subunit dehydrogenase
MISPGKQYGTWALVAGAAEGIGEAFTTSLAASGFNVILVDRNATAMHDLAIKTAAEFRVQTMELHLDLTDADAAERCMDEIIACDCRLIVYVAAWSRVSRFVELPAEDIDGFLAVNTHTLLRLVHRFTVHLFSGGNPGGIILVSSLAGLIGPKYVATYAATKAFAIRLAESLYDELRMEGIGILACCAGTTSTPTYWSSKPDLRKMHPSVMQPEKVARYAINVLGTRPVCIPGWKNRAVYFLLQNIFPKRVARKLVNGAMEAMYGGDPDRV